ncbi:hypothetical protein [Granulicella sp. L60]|uniref:hypothetical protein n=1 Tax=Granulicella sp. L60 TaxID=1641866 RepID=UPI00131D5B98|nr:hypothetical protein [Granulicella sp. L60]
MWVKPIYINLYKVHNDFLPGENMTDKAAVLHPRRLKMDGSYDSICLNCLGTIETSKDDAESSRFDAIHICPPMFVAKRSTATQYPTSIAKI